MGSNFLGTALEGDEPAASEPRDAALRAFVAAVASRELQAPAIFLLEMARPFHLLIQQLLFIADPLLRPWLGTRLLLWTELLGDTATLERAQELLSGTRQTGDPF